MLLAHLAGLVFFLIDTSVGGVRSAHVRPHHMLQLIPAQAQHASEHMDRSNLQTLFLFLLVGSHHFSALLRMPAAETWPASAEVSSFGRTSNFTMAIQVMMSSV